MGTRTATAHSISVRAEFINIPWPTKDEVTVKQWKSMKRITFFYFREFSLALYPFTCRRGRYYIWIHWNKNNTINCQPRNVNKIPRRNEITKVSTSNVQIATIGQVIELLNPFNYVVTAQLVTRIVCCAAGDHKSCRVGKAFRFIKLSQLRLQYTNHDWLEMFCALLCSIIVTHFAVSLIIAKPADYTRYCEWDNTEWHTNAQQSPWVYNCIYCTHQHIQVSRDVHKWKQNQNKD